MLVLTHRQLLVKKAGDADWHAWPLQPGLKLLHHDHAGVGTLELHDAQARLSIWRYTLRNNPAALLLVEHFERLRGQPGTTPAQTEPADAPLNDFSQAHRSEEHTSELQSLMRIQYAVLCLNTKKRILS